MATCNMVALNGEQHMPSGIISVSSQCETPQKRRSRLLMVKASLTNHFSVRRFRHLAFCSLSRLVVKSYTLTMTRATKILRRFATVMIAIANGSYGALWWQILSIISKCQNDCDFLYGPWSLSRFQLLKLTVDIMTWILDQKFLSLKSSSHCYTTR